MTPPHPSIPLEVFRKFIRFGVLVALPVPYDDDADNNSNYNDGDDDEGSDDDDEDELCLCQLLEFPRRSRAIDSGEPRVEINLARDAVVIDVIYQLPFHSINQFGNCCCQYIEIIQNK